MSEGEAERLGVIVRVAKLPMNSVLGAQATDQSEGFQDAQATKRADALCALFATTHAFRVIFRYTATPMTFIPAASSK